MLQPIRSSWRWITGRAWLGHPMLAILLLGAGGWDAYWIANDQPQAPAGRLLAWARGDGGDCECGETLCEIYRAPSGFKIITDFDSADELSRIVTNEPERLFGVDSQDTTTTVGLLAPWWDRTTLRLSITGNQNEPAPPDVVAFARTQVLPATLPNFPAYNAVFQSDPDPLTSEILIGNLKVWGLAHDAAMIPLDLFAVLNMLLVPAYLRRRRFEARQSRNLCPHCRYALAGLPAGAGAGACPECGGSIPARVA